MSMLGLSETIDQLSKANNVHWYSHMLRRKDGHVLRRALDLEVEGQRKTEEDMEKAGEGESVKVGLRRKEALC